MSDRIVKLSSLKKGDRFRLPNDSEVYYKAYYLWHACAWACLLDDGVQRKFEVQKNFEPSRLVVFLRHA